MATDRDPADDFDPADRTILAVDDDPDQLALLGRFLAGRGYRVLTAAGGLEAIERMRENVVDLVVTDLSMPGTDGFAVLEAARNRKPPPPVIIATAFGTVDNAVRAMHQGAYDFVEKPWDPDRLGFAVRRAVERSGLQREVGHLRVQLRTSLLDREFLGDSPPVLALKERIRTVAQTGASVVISGESGTGKELVARSLHGLSPRSGGPFLAVNCGALPEHLLESELFGHVKGAFTGAAAPKKGLVEAAHGGTLFLDEIGDASKAIQQRLLRVLQEREVVRLGSTAPVKVDLQVLCATNKDLQVLMKKGDFREDLYYRLAVVTLQIPPLRDRPGDVSLLAQHFLERCAREFGKPLRGFTPAALDLLEGRPWPGNVRELSNTVRSAAIFAAGETVDAEDLPQGSGDSAPEGSRKGLPTAPPAREEGWEDGPPTFKEARLAFERRYMDALMRRFGGIVAHAAKAAGRTRKDCYALLKRHGLDPDDYRG